MAKNKVYTVKYRRKREGKTDYRKRLALLKSGLPRLVVRRSNNNIICQIVEFDPKGDKTLVAFDALKLKKYGYLGHTSNIPAAYLTGLACGLQAKKKGITKAILDIGLYRSMPGSKLYAALKGALDAGLEINHSEKILPQERRIQGYHIEDYAKILKANQPEEYERLYSKLLKNKLSPENFVEHFGEIKKRITGEFS